MVLGCNFLSWNRYIRKSATDFTGGAPKSTWWMIHHFVKMAHLPHRLIWLIPFEEPQFLLPLPQTSPAPRLLRLQEPCMEIKICQISVRDLIEWLSTGWADQAGSVGFGWTWPLDPQTKACWATPEQSEWFSYMGSLATSPPLCPIWLMVGRCMLSDPTMADWAHPLLWPGDPVPVTQTDATCCWTSWQISLFWAGATCCIEWKTSGRRNHCLDVWPSLDSLSATTFGRPGMCRALESLVSWYTRSRFSIVGHKVGPTSCLLPCLCMTLLWCCRLLQVLSCLSKGLGTLLKPERLL